MSGRTGGSCVILSSLGAEAKVYYGHTCEQSETLKRGQTMVLPAALGDYRIEGSSVLLLSYVPDPEDEAWRLWQSRNGESAA